MIDKPSTGCDGQLFELINLSFGNTNQMKLPPNSLCSNGGKIFIAHNSQKGVMEFWRKGNRARKTENITRVLGMTECMVNCTDSQFYNKLNN